MAKLTAMKNLMLALKKEGGGGLKPWEIPEFYQEWLNSCVPSALKAKLKQVLEGCFLGLKRKEGGIGTDFVGAGIGLKKK